MSTLSFDLSIYERILGGVEYLFIRFEHDEKTGELKQIVMVVSSNPLFFRGCVPNIRNGVVHHYKPSDDLENPTCKFLVDLWENELSQYKDREDGDLNDVGVKERLCLGPERLRLDSDHIDLQMCWY